MPYIDASALALFLPAVSKLTASSVPDLTTADAICLQIGYELDAAALKGGWQVPIASTATSAYGLMALWNQYGAGWHVLEQMMGSGNETGGKTSRAVEYRNAYERAILALQTGTMQLPGAAQADESERVLPRSTQTTSPGCCDPGRGAPKYPIDMCTEF